jgi:WD40 repeat protein
VLWDPDAIKERKRVPLPEMSRGRHPRLALDGRKIFLGMNKMDVRRGDPNFTWEFEIESGKERILRKPDDRIWDLVRGRKTPPFEKPAPGTTLSAHSKDGRLVATAVGVWRLDEVATATEAIQVWDLDTGKELVHFDPGGYVSQLAFSGDGRTLASGMADGSILIWRLPASPRLDS